MLNIQNDENINSVKDTKNLSVEILSEDDKENTALKHNSKDETLQSDTKNKSENNYQNNNLTQIAQKIQEIECQAKKDVSTVETLLKSGILNPQQGESLIQQIIKKGYAELQQCDLRTDNASNVQNAAQEPKQFDKMQAIIEFEKENPEFFKDGGRLDVLNYIKSGILEFDKQELEYISNLVEKIEKSAVDRYIKQAEYEAKLKQTNDEAKSRLSANAQNAKDTSGKQIAFTREQIDKMSSSEFIKNEKLIMEQMKQGLIR